MTGFICGPQLADPTHRQCDRCRTACRLCLQRSRRRTPCRAGSDSCRAPRRRSRYWLTTHDPPPRGPAAQGEPAPRGFDDRLLLSAAHQPVDPRERRAELLRIIEPHGLVTDAAPGEILARGQEVQVVELSAVVGDCIVGHFFSPSLWPRIDRRVGRL